MKFGFGCDSLRPLLICIEGGKIKEENKCRKLCASASARVCAGVLLGMRKPYIHVYTYEDKTRPERLHLWQTYCDDPLDRLPSLLRSAILPQSSALVHHLAAHTKMGGGKHAHIKINTRGRDGEGEDKNKILKWAVNRMNKRAMQHIHSLSSHDKADY